MIAIPATSVTIFGPPAGWEVLPVCVSTSAGSRHFGKCIYIYIYLVYTCLQMPWPPGAGTIASGTKRTANRSSSSSDGFGKLQRPRATGSSDQRNHNALTPLPWPRIARPEPSQPSTVNRRLQQPWGPKSVEWTKPTDSSVRSLVCGFLVSFRLAPRLWSHGSQRGIFNFEFMLAT